MRGYSDYLRDIASGKRENAPAPAMAIAYWNLAPEARLSDAIEAIREDEAIHRDVNHAFADALTAGKVVPDKPGP